MFYFCGSDLESRNACATGNLQEIAECRTYASEVNQLRKDLETPDVTPAGVNVVIETGGANAWSADAVGMNCSMGAEGLAPLAEEYLRLTNLPVIFMMKFGALITFFVFLPSSYFSFIAKNTFLYVVL